MVENTIRTTLKAEHELEHLVESSTDGSTDATEKEFHEMRRVAEQTTLAAFRAAENWGKDALNKNKEHIEEISL